jgi:hypothetical protein
VRAERSARGATEPPRGPPRAPCSTQTSSYASRARTALRVPPARRPRSSKTRRREAGHPTGLLLRQRRPPSKPGWRRSEFPTGTLPSAFVPPAEPRRCPKGCRPRAHRANPSTRQAGAGATALALPRRTGSSRRRVRGRAVTGPPIARASPDPRSGNTPLGSRRSGRETLLDPCSACQNPECCLRTARAPPLRGRETSGPLERLRSRLFFSTTSAHQPPSAGPRAGHGGCGQGR